jgi:hypothetical protein
MLLSVSFSHKYDLRYQFSREIALATGDSNPLLSEKAQFAGPLSQPQAY